MSSRFGEITAQDVGLFVGVLLIFLMFAGVLIALAELRLGWIRLRLLKVCLVVYRVGIAPHTLASPPKLRVCYFTCQIDPFSRLGSCLRCKSCQLYVIFSFIHTFVCSVGRGLFELFTGFALGVIANYFARAIGGVMAGCGVCTIILGFFMPKVRSFIPVAIVPATF